jgi:hypothetical protein
MSKEQYHNLLQLRDEMLVELHPDLAPDDGYLPIFELESESLPKYSFGPYFNELSIILESKIFRDGQFNVNRYKYFQINDFKQFIWLLCDKIHDFSPIDVDQSIIDSLLNLLKCIEECNNSIRGLFGKVQGARIAAFGEKLRTSLSTMMDPSKKSSQQFFITELDLTKQLTDIFKKHIPGAREGNISVGVSKVLKLFGIKCKPKTITMREYRKRKALPEK